MDIYILVLHVSGEQPSTYNRVLKSQLSCGVSAGLQNYSLAQALN